MNSPNHQNSDSIKVSNLDKKHYMPNLPQVQAHSQLTQVVNARELHGFLQSRQDFSTWIKSRIVDYDFVENQDYIIWRENTAPQKNGAEKSITYANWQGKIEYAISLDMAKELSMVERNEQGKQARKYFIECEKRLQATQRPALPDFTNPAAAARAWAEEFEKREQAEKAKLALEHQAKLNAPKVAHYDRVADRKNLINASQVGAKVGLSAVKLNKLLDDFGVYNKSVKRNARTFNLWFIAKGLGEMKQSEAGYDQALFTHKGEAWIIEKLTNEGVVA